MRRAERLQALAEHLRRHPEGSTAERLAAEFGVSVRTIKRDLAALDSSGLPLWSRPGPGGGYGLTERSTLPPVNLSASQAVALLAAVEASGGAPFSDLARAGMAKILDVMDPGTRARAVRLADRVWVDETDRPVRRVRSALEAGLAEQRVVRLRYRDAEGRQTRRAVEPLLFAASRGRWYLVAWCRLRDAVRWFHLGRIEAATLTREPCGGHTIEEVGTPPEHARPIGPP